MLRLHGAPAIPGQLEAIARGAACGQPCVIHTWRDDRIELADARIGSRSDGPDALLHSTASGASIVFDGRLDHIDGLAATQQAEPARTALAAWDRWGPNCLTHLTGDFAFAIWEPQRARLTCAVDRCGAAQLFWAASREAFAFASTEEALLALPWVSAAPNEHLIAQILHPGYRGFQPTRSWLADVHDVDAGGLVHVTRDGVTRRSYARWSTSRAGEATSPQQFRAVFREAVDDRLVSAPGRAALLLSGGLDSATIQLCNAATHSYSAVSGDRSAALERDAVFALADTATTSTVVGVEQLQAGSPHEALYDIAWTRPHPRDNALLLPAWLMRCAARDGHDTVLHGASGDTALQTPLRYIAHHLAEGRWRIAVAEARSASAHHTYLAGFGSAHLLALNAWTAFAPRWAKSAATGLRSASAGKGPALIAGAFAQRIGVPDADAQSARADRALAPVHEELCAAWNGGAGPALGLTGYAQLARRFALRAADPWGDARVLDLLMHTPFDLKVRNGWTKSLVREAFPDLPPAVRWRADKQHIGWEVNAIALEGLLARSGHDVEGILEVLARYVDAAVARTMLAPFTQGRTGDWQAFIDARQLTFELASLAMWLERLASHERCARMRAR